MTTYLVHHGIKGQKWGVRRYQNEDGSLTQAGKERYGQLRDRLSAVDSKKATRLNDRYKRELGMTREEAYRKADEQRHDVMFGKLSYKKSIFKDINDIEESEKASSIEDVNEKVSIGESFLNDYLNDNDTKYVTYDNIEKFDSGNNSFVEEFFRLIEKNSSEFEGVYVDKDGNFSKVWNKNSVDYALKRK